MAYNYFPLLLSNALYLLLHQLTLFSIHFSRIDSQGQSVLASNCCWANWVTFSYFSRHLHQFHSDCLFFYLTQFYCQTRQILRFSAKNGRYFLYQTFFPCHTQTFGSETWSTLLHVSGMSGCSGMLDIIPPDNLLEELLLSKYPDLWIFFIAFFGEPLTLKSRIALIG